MDRRNLVVGTAGHVDHGKTALVKSLTDTETDILAEERRRGITIEPGYASLTLPSGQSLDFVDVPGHEKLVRNMLRGITGVDIALLVVAADDGPMPQTREHLAILDLLDVRTGVVVLTKTDLVDADLLELAEAEIGELIAKTTLAPAPIIRFSAPSALGRGQVIAALESCADVATPKEQDRPFRLPVDRVLRLSGHGTVVTGTVATGTVCEGQRCQVYPGEEIFKARRVHIHKQAVDSVSAGERAGVNLASARASDIERGMVLAEPGSLLPTHLMNARLRLLPGAAAPLTDRQRVKFFTGTSEVNCRVVLLEEEGGPDGGAIPKGGALMPGGDTLVQFRLEEQISALVFDKYVVRTLSPAQTIGGGVILDVSPRKYRRHDQEVIAGLKTIETGSAIDVLALQARRQGMRLSSVSDLSQCTGLTRAHVRELARELVEQGVMAARGKCYVHVDAFERLKSDILHHMDVCYRDRPRWTVPKEELRSRVYHALEPELYNWALHELETQAKLWSDRAVVGLVKEGDHLTARQRRIRQDIMLAFGDPGRRTLRPPQLRECLPKYPRREVDEIVRFLVDRGSLVALPEGSLMDAEALAEARARIAAIEGAYTLAEARDVLGLGRRAVQAILEHLDRLGVTKRIGDERVNVGDDVAPPVRDCA